MTIRISVKVEDERDCQIEVLTMNGNGSVISSSKTLNGGESADFWVHFDQQLIVHETKN